MEVAISLKIALVASALLISANATNEDRFVLIAEGKSGRISKVNIDSLEKNTVTEDPLQNIIDVDYNPLNSKVYWVENKGATIRSVYLNGSEPEVVLRLSPSSRPEGIALDPVARLIFFTDNGRDTINIVKENGQDHRMLVEGTPNPRSIVLDVARRRIYWSDWGLGTIESSSYDGTDRRAVVRSNRPAWINGIDIDFRANRLYWTDAFDKTVKSADINGSNQMELFSEEFNATNLNTTVKSPHLFGIAVSDLFVYFTEWGTMALYRSSRDGQEILSVYRNDFPLNGVNLYDSALYIQGDRSSCQDNNGGCSNLCIPLENRVVCACPNDRRLQEDNKTCSETETISGPQIIWVEHDLRRSSNIRGIRGEPYDYLGSQLLSMWKVPSPSWLWTAVDMDYAGNYLYLVDQMDRYIVQVSVVNLSVAIVYNGTSSEVSGIAYDWIAGNVYWTDSLYNWIMMAKATPRSPYHKTVIDSDLDEPHGIAVWPQKGLLVWSDWGADSKVEVSTLAGDNRRVLWNSKVNRPRGITIDYDNDRVYWCSQYSIHSVYFDGEQGTNYTYHGGFVGNNFIDIALHSTHIFAIEQIPIPRLWFFARNSSAKIGVRAQLPMIPFGITMFSEERQNRNIENRCSDFGCEHMCVNLGDTGAKCVCSDGYNLANDGKSCIMDTTLLHYPSYIYSLGTQLCILAIKDSLATIPSPSDLCFYNNARSSEFRALQFNYNQGVIYFSDNGDGVKSIRRAHIVSKSDNAELIQGVGQVNGIAIDWVSENVYFTDSTWGQIVLAKTNGIHQSVILDNLASPFGIAIDSYRGKLYWTEQGNDTHQPSIKESNLIGTDIVAFPFSQLRRPGCLTRDIQDDRLFCVDHGSNELYFIRLNDRTIWKLSQPMSNGQPLNIYDIAVFQDKLVISGLDATSTSVVLITKKDGVLAKPTQIRYSGRSQVFDVIAYAKSNQPTDSQSLASCASSNGRCDHFCIPLPGYGFNCSCAPGFRLQHDGRTCSPARILSDNFFLIADDFRYQVYQTDTKFEVLSAANTQALDRPMSLDFDFDQQRLYWSDYRASLIKSSLLDGSGVSIVSQNKDGSRVDGIAFESQSGLLYYTDTNLNEIGVIRTPTLSKKVLVKNDNSLKKPRAIALHPSNGHMYYTTRQPSAGSIQRRNMDGTGLFVLVNEDISWPTGLTLDLDNDNIYWCDAHTERIEVTDLNGGNRRTVYTMSREANPFGIALQGGMIHWTDWSIRGVHSVFLNGSDYVIRHQKQFSGLNEIRFFNRDSLPGPNACSAGNGGCSDICIPMPSNSRVCACPDNPISGESTTTTDGLTCPYSPYCVQFIPNGKWDTDCAREPDTSCGFTCNNGFGPTTRVNPQCNQDLDWDVNLNALCVDYACPSLETPENAELEGECALPANSSTYCTHACKDGFVADGGDSIRFCSENRRWAGNSLMCRQQRYCSPLTLQGNMVPVSDSCTNQNQAEGTVCPLTCKPGFSFAKDIEDPRATCTSEAKWSISDVNCTANGSGTSGLSSKLQSGPVIGGIVGGITLLIVIIIILVGVLLCRRSNKLHRGPRRFSNESSDDSPAAGNPGLPRFDTTTGEVSLGAFDNPMYATNDEMVSYREVTQPGLTSKNMDYQKEAGPLPPKSVPESDLSMTFNDQHQQENAFENPMFGSNPK